MRKTLVSFLLAALLPTLALSARAAIIRVALDGTGDYDVIQDAVEAAASGDTISIGPGNHNTLRRVSPGGTDVLAWVYQSELTFLGDDRTTVILGPPVQGPDPERSPGGIGGSIGVEITVRGVTVRNMGNGILCNGDRLTVSDCAFLGNFQGIDSAAVLSTTVSDSYFENSEDAGILVVVALGGTGVTVSNCDFVSNGLGMDLQTPGSVVRDCTFQGGRVGFQISFGGSVDISGCTFEAIENVGLTIRGGSQAHVVDNVFIPPMPGCITVSGVLTGSQNFLGGGTVRTLDLCGGCTVDFTDNDILNDGAWSAYVGGGPIPVRHLNLTNNYWGSSDAAQIAEWIHDNHDDPNAMAIIDFEPFVMESVPTDESSFGSLKARFGPHEE